MLDRSGYDWRKAAVGARLSLHAYVTMAPLTWKQDSRLQTDGNDCVTGGVCPGTCGIYEEGGREESFQMWEDREGEGGQAGVTQGERDRRQRQSER